jgi:hypothetical protein
MDTSRWTSLSRASSIGDFDAEVYDFNAGGHCQVSVSTGPSHPRAINLGRDPRVVVVPHPLDEREDERSSVLSAGDIAPDRLSSASGAAQSSHSSWTSQVLAAACPHPRDSDSPDEMAVVQFLWAKRGLSNRRDLLRRLTAMLILEEEKKAQVSIFHTVLPRDLCPPSPTWLIPFVRVVSSCLSLQFLLPSS